MADLPRAVTKTISSMPAPTHSSTISWMLGVSTSGSISFGTAFVAGKNRVPSPATGNTALRTLFVIGPPFYARFHPIPVGRDVLVLVVVVVVVLVLAVPASFIAYTVLKISATAS